MDINAGDHPQMTQKSYTGPVKHTPWVSDELEMLEKSWNHFLKCFPIF